MTGIPKKLVAAVRLEGTITEGADTDLLIFGTVKPGVREKMEKLDKTHSILVVTSVVKYVSASRLLWRFLIDNNLTFMDVWCGEGLPTVDLWVDDTAVKL